MANKVIALGFFDGVHIGHGELLKRTAERAKELSFTPGVLTYSPHPSEILAKEAVGLINTTEERCEIIRRLYGISDITVKEFTREYASLSCEAFIDEILIGELSAGYVVAGFDFRFGKGGKGDAEMLRSLCKSRGIGCDIIDRVELDGDTVSSSRIRELILLGDMEGAARLLGHYHCIMSEVKHGARLGREIGFPTINQSLSEKLCIPKFGVYAAAAEIDGKLCAAVTNIGVRPTVAEGEAPRAETHIIGFSGDLYEKTVKVELVKFLRSEVKFSSVEELKEQIARDAELAKNEIAQNYKSFLQKIH